ncbi:OmpA family protein [Leptolyngbya sp. 7M]|uniref:OmpA family protein n=1 Tax=Leptolyngbya sp. 7M TaxID=2812896 RepID=UPI001B8B500C|nr:OmpA family protein [Leptolyngbya sp. 7M]QYO61927.1 OmpA family protein [Leptolyngbya sp. 7M]
MKIYSLVTGFLIMFMLIACGGQRNTASPTEDNSATNSANHVNTPQPSIPKANTPKANFPKANFPKANFPKAKFPQAKFPSIIFPEASFPQVQFPEVTFPNVKIQQDENTTIYTLPADILFDFDKAELRPDAEAALQQISSSIIQRFADASIQINGHTDSIGSDAYNLDLSKRRAESVRQWLTTNKNMNPDQMIVEGLGENQPVAPNTNPDGSDNPQGRQKNRRVEIIVRTSSS